FPRAVAADDAHDFAGVDVERDVFEGPEFLRAGPPPGPPPERGPDPLRELVAQRAVAVVAADVFPEDAVALAGAVTPDDRVHGGAVRPGRAAPPRPPPPPEKGPRSRPPPRRPPPRGARPRAAAPPRPPP